MAAAPDTPVIDPKSFAILGVHVGMSMDEARQALLSGVPVLKTSDVTASGPDGKPIVIGVVGGIVTHSPVPAGSDTATLMAARGSDRIAVVATRETHRVFEVVRETDFASGDRPTLDKVTDLIKKAYGVTPEMTPAGLVVSFGTSSTGTPSAECSQRAAEDATYIASMAAPGNIYPTCGILLHVTTGQAYGPGGGAEIVGNMSQTLFDSQRAVQDMREQHESDERIQAAQAASAQRQAASAPAPKL